MTSALSGIPYAKRRQFAATLGLFAVLFVAVGVVATTGETAGVVRVFSAIAIVIAVVLGLAAWGVAHSVRIDTARADLDDAIDQALAEHDRTCGCGTQHDPAEMHVTGAEDSSADACAHDGAGAVCGHDCHTCVLASMRPSPNRTRAERMGQSAASR